MHMLSTNQKFEKIANWIAANPGAVETVTVEQLLQHHETLNSLEVLDIPGHVRQAISRIERFGLDCGGDKTKTARDLDVMCQELASEGLIQECETTGDIEEALIGLAESNRKIKEQLKESKIFIDVFYSEKVQIKKVKKAKKVFAFVAWLFVIKAVIGIFEFVKGCKVIKGYIVKNTSRLKRRRLFCKDTVKCWLDRIKKRKRSGLFCFVKLE